MYFNGIRYCSILINADQVAYLFQINFFLGITSAYKKDINNLELIICKPLALYLCLTTLVFLYIALSLSFLNNFIRNLYLVWFRHSLRRVVCLCLTTSIFLFYRIQGLSISSLFLVLFFLNPDLILTSTRVLSIKKYKL